MGDWNLPFWLLLLVSCQFIYIFYYIDNVNIPSGTFHPTVIHNREYCIGYNFLKGASKSFQNDSLVPVTLTTHGTADMLKDIESTSKNWDGPISFGLFIDFHSRQSLEYIANVHRCEEDFRDKVSVHFVFLISPYQTKCQPIRIPIYQKSCLEFLKNKSKHRKEIPSPFQLYPFNIMRNVARRGAQTDLHFLIDGDMIPSEKFAIIVKPIANEMIYDNKNRALVTRRFETNEKNIPRNFTQLKMDFKNEKIFEFHHKWFFVGHRIPNITYWFQKSTNMTAWEIPYLGEQWETPVIIHRDSPYNAEYFPARIRDVQSLIYKLCRANYTFHLLSTVFSVHEGIKKDDTMYSKVVSEHSKKFGRAKAFDRYVKEMDENYPETAAKCGHFKT